MRPVFAVLPLLVTLASAVPLPSPQELSLSEFRSLRDEATPNNKVDIIDGYAKIRRQGRRLGGELVQFERPLPARVSFAGSGRQFPSARPKKFTRMDIGPVFSLEDMLKREAAKLKLKVQEASLKAAKAAEEAEKKLNDMVKQVVEETDATHEEVETMLQDAIESGINEAEDIVEEELREQEEENVVDDSTETKKAAAAATESKEEPSGEIDLGSVQEV